MSKLSHFIENQKTLNPYIRKDAIVFILLSFLCLASFVLFSVAVSDCSLSSFSYFLVEQKNNSDAPYNYGEVRTETYNNYSLFYEYADDIPASSIKRTTETFFKGVENDLSEEFSFSTAEDVVFKSSVLFYTAYDFGYVSFDYYGVDSLGLENNDDCYITETVAELILGREGSDEDYANMIDEAFFYDSHLITIKGVIKDSSLVSVSDVFGSTFVLFNYNVKPSYFSKFVYCFFLRGSEISTFSALFFIEGGLKRINGAVSYYFDYNKTTSSFSLGLIQNVKESTLTEYNNGNVLFIILSLTALLSALILSTYLLVKRFSRKSNNQPLLHFLCDFSTFSVVLVILKLIGSIRLNFVTLNLFDFNIVSLVFSFWLVRTFVLLVLFNKKGKERNLIFYEIEV